ALRFRSEVLRARTGTESMNAIAGAIQEGAVAYLRRQFRTLGVFAVIAVVLLLLLPIHGDPQLPEWLLRFSRSVTFLVGAAFSALIGYLGMWLAVRANLRVAAAARGAGREPAMIIAVRTGACVGMAPMGFGLLGARAGAMLVRSHASVVRAGAQWWFCSAPTRRWSWGASASARPWSRCSCAWAAGSSPRPPTSARTWWARWSRTSLRMTPATPRPSLTTSATTWATAPAWRRTCSSPMR